MRCIKQSLFVIFCHCKCSTLGLLVTLSLGRHQIDNFRKHKELQVNSSFQIQWSFSSMLYLPKYLVLSEGVEQFNPSICTKQDKKSDANVVLQRSRLQITLQRLLAQRFLHPLLPLPW
jgi:hypothetical protein